MLARVPVIVVSLLLLARRLTIGKLVRSFPPGLGFFRVTRDRDCRMRYDRVPGTIVAKRATFAAASSMDDAPPPRQPLEAQVVAMPSHAPRAMPITAMSKAETSQSLAVADVPRDGRVARHDPAEASRWWMVRQPSTALRAVRGFPTAMLVCPSKVPGRGPVRR